MAIRKSVKNFLGKVKKDYEFLKLGIGEEKRIRQRLQRIKNTPPIFRKKEDIDFSNKQGIKIKKWE